MTDSEDNWSSPSLYSGASAFEPRTFTENDPMSSMLLADWDAGPDEPRWGSTTYVGKRRLRPDTKPAAETIDAARADHSAAGPQRTAARTDPDAEPAAAAAGQAAPVGARRERSLLANSTTMAIASLVSRATGFLRSILLVAALGTGAVGNAYNGGNTFPNMVYELLLGGVLSSVLIPLLVHAQESDEDDGMAYTQRLLSIAAAALGVMTLLAVAAAPWIAAAVVPEPGQRALTSIFATLLLPEIFFYGLGAMFMAVLNIKHVYGPGAWAPVLNNVVVVITICIFWALPGPTTLNPSNMTNAQILVLGIGTTLGIAAQALVLVPSLRRAGFRWRWRFRAHPNELGRMKEVGTLAGWVLGYVIASQIGVFVILRVGSANGGLTVFTQADLLFQMPYGILVVSLLTAIMPRLSRAAVRGDRTAVVDDLAFGARLSALALIPVTAGLIVLGEPLAQALFAHGQASPQGARLIGSSLALSAFGLFPFAVVMLQLRVFYAMRDGRTPTLINIWIVGVKVALVLIINAAYGFPHSTRTDPLPSTPAIEWLNISTSVSYVVGAVIGHVLLTRRFGPLGFTRVARTVVRIGVPSAVGALAAYGVVIGCRNAFGEGDVGSLAGLVLGALAGVLVLVLVAWRMRLPEVREAVALARRH